MEERRLLLAVALSLLVLTAYSLLFPSSPRRPVPAAEASPPARPPAAPPPPPSPGPSRPAPIPEAALATVAPVADEREKRVEVTGRDVTLAFTNRGARVVSWRLNRFMDPGGKPEEMVQALATGPRPLDLETGDPALDLRLREALFRPSAETVTLPAAGTATLSFEYAEGDLKAEKTLVFEGQDYLVKLAVSVRRGSQALPTKILWGPGVGNPTAAEKEVQGYEAPHGVALTDSGVERLPTDKLPPTGRALAGARWVGVESHYFAALFVPPGERGTAEIRAISLPSGEDGKPRRAPLVALDLGPGAGSTRLYVGPKDYHELTRLDHQLNQVVPVGEWIGPIVVPFLGLLRWVHSHVGNYGWSIVVLTLLINLAMAPFRHYSIANGLKMTKLAPEMKAIQERYRKVPLLDPKQQEKQEEMAALYARHGMSMQTQMMVGCLPLLLTMPFLIAFYRVLTVSIELRGASFLWIPDLSQKDPLFLTPVLMGISMFAMQRMTPTAMDPAQQRIMMIMPLMLMGMFLWAPAGLNLYWLASNLCSIVQQATTLSILRAGEAGPKRERKRR
ncbi:MAG TPA: membrane protein insertase YidC [Vicinamibacteria bacterium]|nr:membrane protein insertase YidC [Vicinamibacteria bacterium]